MESRHKIITIMIFIIVVIIPLATFLGKKQNINENHEVSSTHETYEQGLWAGHKATIEYLRNKGLISDTLIINADSLLHVK